MLISCFVLNCNQSPSLPLAFLQEVSERIQADIDMTNGPPLDDLCRLREARLFVRTADLLQLRTAVRLRGQLTICAEWLLKQRLCCRDLFWAHEVAFAAFELIPKLYRSGSAKREPQRSSSPAFFPRPNKHLLEVEEDSIV